MATITFGFGTQKWKNQQNEHPNISDATWSNTSNVSSFACDNAKPLLSSFSGGCIGQVSYYFNTIGQKKKNKSRFFHLKEVWRCFLKLVQCIEHSVETLTDKPFAWNTVFEMLNEHTYHNEHVNYEHFDQSPGRYHKFY